MARASRGVTIDQARMRELMQSQARAQSRPRRVFETPAWVDHGSFVLPDDHTPAHLAAASPHAVPRPRIVVPEPLPAFDRPPAPEVDYAAVVRRADAGRRARLLTAAGLLAAVVALLVFQLTSSPAAAGCALLAAVVAVGGATRRLALRRAPVPYL